ncbi:TPA: endonuclease [Candidatus Sumerlaeota bacterium]|jgi:crossover junction endodeoxyribonuclease RusA|nr:endonuclease [Candidatus Sumerlaeota bacterium]
MNELALFAGAGGGGTSRKMNKISICLPLPPRELHPNARTHRMAKAKATKQYRSTAYWLALSASANLKPRWKSATVKMTWYFANTRSRDKDNLLAWMKAGLDGIADAGIIANDSGFTHLPAEILFDKANPRVVVEIEKGE